MVEEIVRNEFEQITNHITQGHNFLLSGGAGSGKTYTLVQVIRWIIQNYPADQIACITYTNAAVNEITERVNHDNLVVSTIHDFLWDNIKNYQNELCKVIVKLLNASDFGLSIPNMDRVPDDFFSDREKPISIEYREYTNLKEGILSHDEVILVADSMFREYPKLCDILKSRYPFIMIDEYQDTFPEVVKIMLTHLNQTKKTCIIGFFGDAMQCIYDRGVGDLNDYKHKGYVYEILKTQNRRNPLSVITLANKIRTDGLQQVPSRDKDAPNMENGEIKTGECLFIYTDTDTDVLNSVRMYLSEKKGWNFENPEQTKELNLTHNLIAGKAGFANLMEIYSGDPILKYVKGKLSLCVKSYLRDDEILGKNLGDILTTLQKKGIAEKLYKTTKSQQDYIDLHPELYEIAKSYDFENLCHTYVDSSQLIDDKKQSEDENSKTGSKRSPLVKHLCRIENAIRLYRDGDISEFLKVTGYTRDRKDGIDRRIRSISDKEILKNAIESLQNTEGKTIQNIIELASEKNICIIDDKLLNYKERYPYIYYRMMHVPYSEFISLYNYLEGQTPFSTQHKTKGTEFDNILVILDNGRWNNYNFEKLFAANNREERVVDRTEKIFYVCCTRAKEQLAVFYHKPTTTVIKKAIEWFGVNNIVKL